MGPKVQRAFLFTRTHETAGQLAAPRIEPAKPNHRILNNRLEDSFQGAKWRLVDPGAMQQAGLSVSGFQLWRDTVDKSPSSHEGKP
ncbi:hypothetical protein GCM10027402_35560 [Arthrobacter monumenti]